MNPDAMLHSLPHNDYENHGALELYEARSSNPTVSERVFARSDQRPLFQSDISALQGLGSDLAARLEADSPEKAIMQAYFLSNSIVRC